MLGGEMTNNDNNDPLVVQFTAARSLLGSTWSQQKYGYDQELAAVEDMVFLPFGLSIVVTVVIVVEVRFDTPLRNR